MSGNGSFIQSAKDTVKNHPVLSRWLAGPLKFVTDRTINRAEMRRQERQWESRLADALACPDNAFIPRVPDAGRITRGVQVMHNGLKIRLGSYYGQHVTRMLELNKGVHEPQEERVFAEVLTRIPQDRPAVMIELGSYWAFYSLWFATVVAQARCIMVEPEARNIKMGQGNFALNGKSGEFIRAFVGGTPGVDRWGNRTITVDEIFAEKKLKHADILHSDIQGFEAEMLKGAARTLGQGLVDYIFISTHSQPLHEECRRRLGELGYDIIADADMAATYSFDGLIAAKRSGLPGVDRVAISMKPSKA